MTGNCTILTKNNMQIALRYTNTPTWKSASATTSGITRNGKGVGGRQRINSGKITKVTGFTPEGDITTEAGKTIPRHYGHISYGYVVTSYVAQGKTVKDVYIAESWESFPAAGREQFYVSASRGTEKLVLVTDNKRALFEAVQLSRQRLSALDMTIEEAAAVLIPPDHKTELIKAQNRARPFKPKRARRRVPAQTYFPSMEMDRPEHEPKREEIEAFEPEM